MPVTRKKKSAATIRHGTGQCRTVGDSAQRGYVLLTLLLIVTMMIIAAGAVVQTIAFEIKRDREEEMIHRGVQYARAIRSYYKKLGRYPTKLEDLENTNNQRYLRKRYKDPITGKDFKLLHYGEAKMSLGNMLGGGGIPGANPIGGTSGLNGGFGANGLSGSSGFGPSGGSGFGGGSNGFGSTNSRANSFSSSQNSSSSDSSNQNSQDQGSQSQSQNQTSQGSDTNSSDPSAAANQSGSSPNQNGLSASGDKLSQQVFGGGPIVGVVSLSKKEGVREFDHKKKYEQWQFIYDQATDRGGLINGPNPTVPAFAAKSLQPGQPGQSGNNSPFSSSPGMGNNSSFGGSSFGGSNPSTPAPPPTSNPQQQ